MLFRHHGKQSSQSFDDPVAARRWQLLLDQVGPDKALEVLAAEASGTMAPVTVAEWAEHYIGHLTGIGRKALHDYRTYVRRDIAPVMGQLPLLAVDRDVIAEWVNGLESKGLAAKTIANKHGFLFAMFKAAVADGKIPTNPCAGTRLPRSLAPEMVFLTQDEFAALHDAMTERYRVLLRLLVASGARLGEVTALTVGDIDPDRQTARISKAWKPDGRGGAILGPPKTRRSLRTVNLPAELITDLRLDRPAHQLLFENARGGPVRQDTLRSRWNAAIRSLVHLDDRGRVVTDHLHGKRPRIHDLRHTCASWMIAAGIPLPVIQAHLGHESIKTTVDTYGHLDRHAHASAAAAIAAMLPATSGPAHPAPPAATGRGVGRMRGALAPVVSAPEPEAA
ncbi:tyrosine-type recombinase/integrase [Nocardia terpenica]|uniref:Integrase n=1 Tax=Nocardia terpenica TaxID=455432 RepID=A0A164HCV9_9NOCA|nr:site-specific integrase [Nocardia terpenica]KZM68403.1 hypothetical protein AWN90_10980 [Nocardia terpenica]